ncbi:MAG: Crp/Fnr family transcriptional regulator [Actinomycetota bacterium]
MKPFPTEVDNLLLEAMTASDRAQILAHGERFEFALGDRIFTANEDVPFVVFPHAGMLSVVTQMQDGSSVETVTIGKEGATGPPIVVENGMVSNVDCLCQLPGGGLRVPTREFFELRHSSTTFDELLDRYAQVVFGQIAQTAACNRLHGIEARASRWLLQAHDRFGDELVPLTQEFLAEMLGVRRETVSLTTRILQNAGLIETRRGEVRIVDRDGLESTSCECYGVMRDDLERLFPFLQA